MTQPAPWTINASPKAKKMRVSIRRASPARAKQARTYSARVAVWKVGKVCAVPGCRKTATDCHHSRGRVGRLLLDERFWVPVCRRCHDWIGRAVVEARALGLLAPVGQWNTQPKG